ncbi:MAG: CPBP family intramembrane metalloprotease [Deltaproteobacteria bacterium]|nr:CPBP family intramembrane metalloprotease [Candidatus Zymogenaceae bacterium]
MTLKTTGTLLSLILFCLMVIVTLLVPSAAGPYRWLLIVPLAGAVVFFRFSFFPLFGPTLFLLLCYLFRFLPLPPLSVLLIIPIAVYTGIVLTARPVRRETTWLSRCAVTPRLVIGAVAVVAVSSAALVAWYLIMDPDITVFTEFIPARPLYQLLVGGLAFALLNGVVEEVIFRGILWDGIKALVPAPWVLLTVQALFFGTAHFWGVPNGIVGAVMATIYGLMLGIIRLRADGLLMAIITHVFADIVIFCILLDIAGRI